MRNYCISSKMQVENINVATALCAETITESRHVTWDESKQSAMLSTGFPIGHAVLADCLRF